MARGILRLGLFAVHQGGGFGAPVDGIQTWQGQEAMCTLGAAPTITADRLAGLLPEVSPDRPGLTFALDNVYAGVRLTDMVAHGCAGAWWDGSSGRQ